MVAQTVSTFGRLDAAFNNAGIQSPAVETADASGEECDRVNGINQPQRMELHEVRAEPNAPDKEAAPSSTTLRLAVLMTGSRAVQCTMHPSTEWYRADEERRARICLQRNSHQCG